MGVAAPAHTTTATPRPRRTDDQFVLVLPTRELTDEGWGRVRVILQNVFYLNVGTVLEYHGTYVPMVRTGHVYVRISKYKDVASQKGRLLFGALLSYFIPAT